ncbi:MAG: hypothetical protein U1E76_09225 [Planctomycetota bacterium]
MREMRPESWSLCAIVDELDARGIPRPHERKDVCRIVVETGQVKRAMNIRQLRDRLATISELCLAVSTVLLFTSWTVDDVSNLRRAAGVGFPLLVLGGALAIVSSGKTRVLLLISGAVLFVLWVLTGLRV